MKKQSAKFFCENCGAEVPQNAKVCRHCGKFFSSVRCPVCGTTGSPSKFAKGCPNCGYAVGKGKVLPPMQKEKYSVSGFDVLRKTSKYDTKRIFRQGYILDWNKDENIEALKTMALNIKNREK